MVGTTKNPIQIDEARFAGRRKYKRGRMPNGDNALLSEDSDAEQESNGNHGRRIDGSWVVSWQGSPVSPGRGNPTIRRGPIIYIVLVS